MTKGVFKSQCQTGLVDEEHVNFLNRQLIKFHDIAQIYKAKNLQSIKHAERRR